MAVRPMRAATMRSISPVRPPTSGAVEVVLFHDVLCAWCYVADQRLSWLREEYGPALRWSYRPYPLRPEDEVPDRKERQALAKTVRAARREREGKNLSPDLWVGRDPPHSSMPALIALEAARAQGEDVHDQFLVALREAALVRSVNVSRRDVLLELAGNCGIDLGKLVAGMESAASLQRVQEAMREAENIGVRGVPALVIGDEWLMQGCRDLGEYRQVIDKYLNERAAAPLVRVFH